MQISMVWIVMNSTVYDDFLERRKYAKFLWWLVRDILDWTVEQGIQNFVYTHKSDNAFQVLEIWASGHHFRNLVKRFGFARKPSPEALLFLIDKYGLERNILTILVTVGLMWRQLFMREYTGIWWLAGVCVDKEKRSPILQEIVELKF